MINWFGYDDNVGDIVRPLAKIQKRLEDHAAASHLRKQTHLDESDRHKQHAVEAHGEAAQATAVATKIAALLA